MLENSVIDVVKIVRCTDIVIHLIRKKKNIERRNNDVTEMGSDSSSQLRETQFLK